MVQTSRCIERWQPALADDAYASDIRIHVPYQLWVLQMTLLKAPRPAVHGELATNLSLQSPCQLALRWAITWTGMSKWDLASVTNNLRWKHLMVGTNTGTKQCQEFASSSQQ